MSKSERRKRKQQLFAQLRLQGELLCESHSNPKYAEALLSRMMKIVLELVKERSLNEETRRALASHFVDCAYDPGHEPTVELGGPYERDSLYLNGVFDIKQLSKRLTWS